jgi:hypothetical protein
MKLAPCADGEPSNGGTGETEVGGDRQMRGLWVLAVVCVVFLLQACTGNGQNGEPSAATATPTSQAAAITPSPQPASVTPTSQPGTVAPSPQPATGTPTSQPTTGTPTSQLDPSEVITIVQEYQVVKKVEGDDGSLQMILVPLASRVDEYCSDSPQWSTREGSATWRVIAECTKEPSVPGSSPLRFEWLFDVETRSVLPFNHPAHVAQYQYPWEQEPGYFEPWY